ncbi:hypothetical protein Cgig2_010845 [Carnegiea gigantea]|uniref:DUF4283 domain-containing protein n=1 Tax=Carnegiea gigantea TaxID=171969 RepID=A0A9Q1GSY8_9CARY|nr:hypothetical protein Cgig2_010845 [Carnegiea gigantea]
MAESLYFEKNDDDTRVTGHQATPIATLEGNPTGILPIGPSHPLKQKAHSDQPVPSGPHCSQLDELLACCLIGKIMGDPLPISAIIHKTIKDWYFVKGHVDYIDAGNDWIMIRFTNAEDRMLVFDQRPWHVNGLNFVVQKWTPFFDCYSATINRIDQWVTVLRLPWEFWDHDSLAELLKPVTVSPKKRVRPALGPRHRKLSNLKPQDLPILTKDLVNLPSQEIPTPLNPNGIVLANLIVMKSQDEGSSNSDKLMAMDNVGDKGMDEEENVDMFLNLGNIEDMKMSTDSSKRKRIEEGEECNS